LDAIAVDDVTKVFGDKEAVSGLSLRVPRGSIYGLLGPNGSGKTTTLRMILNILLPDRGTIAILGERGARAVRDKVGYLPEERGLYRKAKVRALLYYLGELKGKTRRETGPLIERWLERFDLVGEGDRRVDALSKGMAQKVQLIAALVGSPELLVLDEPFSGLDPVNLAAMRDAILDLRREGVTILVSTHEMTAAEALCDRIAMMFRGKKAVDGTLEELQRGFDRAVVRVEVGDKSVLSAMQEVRSFHDEGRAVRVELTTDPQAFLRRLVERTEVRRFDVARPSLADVFVRMAKG
jgi:ABC-2 type transport system ATP-binding protein